MSSSSTTEARSVLATGVEVAGFRIEGLIGRGPRATVYEATQLSLGRRVALKVFAPDPVLADRCRRLRWPEHPNVVTMFAAGSCEHGPFVAMQLVRGPTLAEARHSPTWTPQQEHDVLDQVAAALAATHRSGLTHGALHAGNVLIGPDGRALVTDVGLAAGPATPASDLAALAGLATPRDADGRRPPDEATPATPAAPPAVGRRRVLTAGLAGLAAVAALAGTTVLVVSGDEDDGQPNLPTAPGAIALGSTLNAPSVASVDCNGRTPSGSSPQCTVIQTRLPGATLTVRRDGVIRTWAVRGARGELALEVLRREPGGLVPTAHTPYTTIPDAGTHVRRANLPLAAGDVVGVRVAPGSTIGIGRDARGASAARLLGVPVALAREPRTTGFDHELMLRVEYVPGARASVSGRLSGVAAATAPDGTVLRTRELEPRGGVVRSVEVVRVGARIVLDLREGATRVSRVPVAGARAGGRLVALTTLGRPVVNLRWRNPGGADVARDYDVGPRALAPRG